jgi:proteic killer suppression protein
VIAWLPSVAIILITGGDDAGYCQIHGIHVFWTRVIQSFADATTEDLFHGANTKAARAVPKAIWPIVRRKLDLLNAAAAVQDLRVPPGNHLEPLKGDQAGRWSIRVNQQYRITFRFDGGNAFELCCEDYH